MSRIKLIDILEEAHDNILNRFSSQDGGTEENAKKLEDFFRNFKNFKTGAEGQGIKDKIVYAMVWDKITKGRFKNKEQFMRMKGLGAKGGFRFEREMAALINAVAQTAFEGDKEALKILNKELKEVPILQGDKFAQGVSNAGIEVARALGQKTIKHLKKEKTQNLFGTNVVDKYQKVDIGLNVSLEANEDSLIGQIFNLLNHSSFSLKNYSSEWFDKNIGSFVPAKGQYIGLGKTILPKSLGGPLSQVGITAERINEATLWKPDLPKFSEHIYHIRQVYELTGFGQSSGIVDYLIYNDPATNEIYVRSTKNIVKDFLSNTRVPANALTAPIKIAKSYFVNH